MRQPMRQQTMWMRLCSAFLAYSLAGCAGTPVLAPLQAGSYPMKPGESVAIGGGASVRYDAFSDSRCPTGAQCIWAGKVSYAFTLSGAGGAEAFALEYEGQRVAAKSLAGVNFGISFAGVNTLPVAQRAVVLDVATAAR